MSNSISLLYYSSGYSIVVLFYTILFNVILFYSMLYYSTCYPSLNWRMFLSLSSDLMWESRYQKRKGSKVSLKTQNHLLIQEQFEKKILDCIRKIQTNLSAPLWHSRRNSSYSTAHKAVKDLVSINLVQLMKPSCLVSFEMPQGTFTAAVTHGFQRDQCPVGRKLKGESKVFWGTSELTHL